MARLNALMSWFCCCLGVALLIVSSLVVPEGALADTGAPDDGPQTPISCPACGCSWEANRICNGTDNNFCNTCTCFPNSKCY